jgi:hypothetical protein
MALRMDNSRLRWRSAAAADFMLMLPSKSPRGKPQGLFSYALVR